MLARGLASSTARLKEKDRVMGWLVGEGICLKWVKLCERTMLSMDMFLILSLDRERLSWEPLKWRLEVPFGSARPDMGRGRRGELHPLWLALGAPRGLCASLVLGVLEVCFGMAFGLETDSNEEPDLRIVGVPGVAFFPSLRNRSGV